MNKIITKNFWENLLDETVGTKFFPDFGTRSGAGS
jgi:hypothetical protein